MKNLVFLVGLFVLLTVGCAGNPTTNTGSPITVQQSVPATAVPEDRGKQVEDLLFQFTMDERYDPTKSVLHKYLDTLRVEVDNTGMYFILNPQPADEEDAVTLATDLFLLGGIIDQDNGWNSPWFVLRTPGRSNWDFQFTISGPILLGQVLGKDNGGEVLYQNLIFEVAPQLATAMTADAAVPQYPLCEALPLGSNEVCAIQKVYCSYQPSMTGQPTFCGNKPYPSNTFNLVVWGEDVSYYDGRCLIVTGLIESYDGRKEISAEGSYAILGTCE